MKRSLWFAAVALTALHGAHAFELEHSQARYVDKHYEYELVAVLDAPLERVQAVLRDYARYPRLDERILEARVIARPESYVALLATRVRACFGPFCRDVSRIERVEELPLGLRAVADPAASDVKFGETSVFLSRTETGTRVSYRTSIVPGFWVPPFPGRRWMLRTLEDSTNDMFVSIEREAKER